MDKKLNTEYQGAREKIAHWLCGDGFDYIDEVEHEVRLEEADELLSLTWPDGSQMIGVIAGEQELPQITKAARTDRKWCAAFICGLTEMLKSNFRQIVEKQGG